MYAAKLKMKKFPVCRRFWQQLSSFMANPVELCILGSELVQGLCTHHQSEVLVKLENYNLSDYLKKNRVNIKQRHFVNSVVFFKTDSVKKKSVFFLVFSISFESSSNTLDN